MTGHKSTKCTTQIVAMFHFDLEAAAITLCQSKVRCHFLLKNNKNCHITPDKLDGVGPVDNRPSTE